MPKTAEGDLRYEFENDLDVIANLRRIGSSIQTASQLFEFLGNIDN